MVSKRDPRITKLERAARRLVIEKTCRDQAVVELQQISADPDVLGVAAGRALGRTDVLPMFNPHGEDIAALLVRAGADQDIMVDSAQDTARRLRIYLGRG